MIIADYLVLISPAGIPFFSTGLQELKKDPVLLGGFLKALESFTSEEIVEKKQPIVNIRHIQWKDFNITLCNPFWETWDLDEPEKVVDREHLPLLATFNFSNRPHLQDPTILKGILQYLFDGLELESWMDQIEKIGRIPEKSNKELESRVGRVIFGNIPRAYAADGLILTVGTTWGSIFAALQQHNPKCTIFLCSEASEKIARDICRTFGLVEKQDYKILLMDPDDTSMVAKTSANAHHLLVEKLGRDSKIIINATGGTKSLTSGAMHYGFVRQLTTCYVISYEFRKQREDRIYGDEEILLLDNPVQSVGFFYEKQGIDAFNSQNFKLAKEYFSQLAFNIHDLNVAIYFDALTSLSDAYFSQKQMNYEELVPFYQQAIEKLIRFCYTKHPHGKVVNEFLPQIEKQEMLAHRLASKEPQDAIIHICEKMNQSNRLFEEKYFHLATLQACIVINEIFNQILTIPASKKEFNIPKTFKKDLNHLLALELKLDVLKETQHDFIQEHGIKVLRKPVIALKKFFTITSKHPIDLREKDYKTALEAVNDLFNKFVIFFGGEEGLKNYQDLQFIYLHPPML